MYLQQHAQNLHNIWEVFYYDAIIVSGNTSQQTKLINVGLIVKCQILGTEV